MEYNSKKEERFDSIYRAYAKDIYKTAIYYTKDENVAQEITQEAFYKLYIHFEHVNPEKVRPWLAQTVRNMAFNVNRDSKSEVLGESAEITVETEPAMPSIEDQYLREQQAEMERELVESIFDRLQQEHPIWYEALTLVYCLEKPQQEVADELEISLDMLHGRLYRAKQWIRKYYGERYSEVVK